MSFRIRPYTAADAPALGALYRASVMGLGAGHYTAEQLAAWQSARNIDGPMRGSLPTQAAPDGTVLPIRPSPESPPEPPQAAAA